jgi:GTP cyclohydrolase I
MPDVFDGIEEYFRSKYRDWEGATQFEGTGDRLRRMVGEMCWDEEFRQSELKKCYQAVFEESYSEMLVVGPTSVWTLCPHHLVPCHYQVYIGYCPNGKVLGLSKFSRIALLVGKRPIMQEQYTRELAESIEENLDPLGCGVYIIGTHGCIMCRGVTQSDIRVSTTALKGVFLEDSKVRDEFYSICRGG